MLFWYGSVLIGVVWRCLVLVGLACGSSLHLLSYWLLVVWCYLVLCGVDCWVDVVV